MDRKQRLASVVRQLNADKIDVLVAFSAAYHSCDVADPLTHLCGFRSLGVSALIVYADGASELIATPLFDEERALACQWVVAVVAADSLSAELGQRFANSKKTIAIAGLDHFPHRLRCELLGAIGSNPVPFDRALYAATAAKTEDEIENARKATEIAERGYEYLLTILRPGARECDLALQLNCHMKELGANDIFLMMGGSAHNRGAVMPSTRELAVGDIVIAEITPSYDGQFAQICRTVVIGPAPAVLEEKYALVVRAMEAGLDIIRPGTAMADVCRAMDRVLQDQGYAEYCSLPYMRRRGHGYGCGSVEPGDVATDNATILEEDMAFVVHPNQYLPETGYLLCGEPVRVTATGIEVMSLQRATLGSVPA